MAEETPKALPRSIQVLIVCNRMVIKAFNAKNRQSLIFTILNDTVHVIPYDRAILWDMSAKPPKLLGVSGQSQVNKEAEIVKKWEQLVQSVSDPAKPQQLTEESFPGKGHLWKDVQAKSDASVLWLPIYTQDKLVLGLWLERWHRGEADETLSEDIDLFMNFLMPGYGSAWQRFSKAATFTKHVVNKKYVLGAIFALVLILFFVQTPLRVVAPCEVVPGDPYLVTAPLEGIIDEVLVDPGDQVEKGQVLFEYDKRVPMQALKIAQKDVDITSAELDRVTTLGIEERETLEDLAILKLKLEKANIKLDLASYNASLLEVKAPISGIALLSDPDSWRGKPVKVGEKVLTIGKLDNTKVRIWIPEDDNIILNRDIPVQVYLNINPDRTREAKITFISNESTINENNLPSFVAEAEWLDPQEDVKLGLKGTATLYGERVSLLYYFFRRPLIGIRNLFGI